MFPSPPTAAELARAASLVSGVASRPRRDFLLATAAAGAALWTRPGRFADELTPTAKMTVGPFFPDHLPLDTDNDLLILSDRLTPAVGEIVHLGGRILSRTGQPLRNALVEIWQVDHHGSYIHSKGARDDGQRDTNFQGYGRFLTDLEGRYYFRTIKPVPYSVGNMWRTPHIHFSVSRGDRRLLATQMMIRGHEANERDELLRGIRDPKLRDTVLADFQPLPGSSLGELQSSFDIVLGHTLEELDDGRLGNRDERGTGRP